MMKSQFICKGLERAYLKAQSKIAYFSLALSHLPVGDACRLLGLIQRPIP